MCIVSKLSQLPVLFEGVGLLLGPKGALNGFVTGCQFTIPEKMHLRLFFQ